MSDAIIVNDIVNDQVIPNGQDTDTRIRFSRITTQPRQFYGYAPSNSVRSHINPVPGALNLIFANRPNDVTARGYTNYNSSSIVKLNDLNQILADEENPSFSGRVIIHELGHVFGLRHSFHCNNPCDGTSLIPEAECGGRCALNDGESQSSGCYGEGTGRGLAMGYNGDQSNFTVCEMEEMYRNILNRPIPYFDIESCIDNSDSRELVLDAPGTIIWSDGARIVNSDLIIASGTTLDLRCRLEMGADKKIYLEEDAKLIVDGGMITSHCKQDRWQGVKVTASGDYVMNDFSVKLVNGAIVENVPSTLVSFVPNKPWPEQQNFGNGQIIIDGATLRDAKRGIEFIAYQPSINNSTINNCTFSNLRDGFTSWNCRSITISDCEFEDISRRCIGILDGGVFGSNNEFDSDSENIIATNGPVGSHWTGNSFHGPEIGILSYNSAGTETTIFDNSFYNENTSVELSGSNNSTIELNTFHTVDYAVAGHNTGDYRNHIIGNTFNSPDVSIYLKGDNKLTQFYENCFNSVFYDVNMYNVQIPVKLYAGTTTQGDLAAANCFTREGPFPNDASGVTGAPSGTEYIMPPGYDDTCLDEYSPQLIKTIGVPNTSVCGEEAVSFGKSSPSSANKKSSKRTTSGPELLNWSQQAQERLSHLGRSSSTTSATNSEGLQKSNPLELPEAVFIKTFYDVLEFDSRSSAMDYLAIPFLVSEELNDFISAQLIFNQYAGAGTFRMFEHPTHPQLLNIALKEHPYSSYARGFHYFLTGELISSEVILSTRTDTEKKVGQVVESSTNPEINEGALLFPNPVGDISTLQFKNPFTGDVQILSVEGQVVQTLSLTEVSGAELDSSTFPPGIYVGRAKSENSSEILTFKFIKH